jgi:hypothetical protein
MVYTVSGCPVQGWYCGYGIYGEWVPSVSIAPDNWQIHVFNYLYILFCTLGTQQQGIMNDLARAKVSVQ